MAFNLIYNNNGIRTPSGSTNNQTVAGLNMTGIYFQSVPLPAQSAQVGNSDAASVIQSNGESIGNAQLASNPLPPGITS
jgi:hypothetical protein